MSRRRIHAGFTLAGFVVAAALATACIAAAVLSLTGPDESTDGHAHAQSADEASHHRGPEQPAVQQPSGAAAVPPSDPAAPLPADPAAPLPADPAALPPVDPAAPPPDPAAPPADPAAPPVANKNAAMHKDPAAIEVNVGDCVAFGGENPAPGKTACGSPGSSYKVVDKAGPDRQCPTDVDRSAADAAAGSLCLDINWTVGSCMDVASEAPTPVACGAPARQPVRVTDIKRNTANVNECSSGNRGFVYDQRRFVVCVASE